MLFINKKHVRGRGKSEREENMALIINRVARLGTTLFSQPTTWEFSWNASTDSFTEHSQQDSIETTKRREEVVVFPAIWKTGYLDGRKLLSGVLKLSPEVYLSSTMVSIEAMHIEGNSFQLGGNSLQKEETTQKKEVIGSKSKQKVHPNNNKIQSTPRKSRWTLLCRRKTISQIGQ